MSYFKNFDVIKYDFTIPGEDRTEDLMVDLMTRVHLNISKEDLNKMCDDIVIGDGMTPERLAFDLYGDQFKHWTILYVNGITDIHAEWPLSENELFAFCSKKYGEGLEHQEHHYEKMPERLWIDPDFCMAVYGEEARLVTNYEHEMAINDAKRHIKVIKPEYIAGFVSQFEQSLVR